MFIICLLTGLFFLISRLSASQEEKPLKFEDIVNKTTYDKMRPPKPEGNYDLHFCACCYETFLMPYPKRTALKLSFFQFQVVQQKCFFMLRL